jgi:hypothetical protein
MEHQSRAMTDPSFHVLNVDNCTLKQHVHIRDRSVVLTEGNPCGGDVTDGD